MCQKKKKKMEAINKVMSIFPFPTLYMLCVSFVYLMAITPLTVMVNLAEDPKKKFNNLRVAVPISLVAAVLGGWFAHYASFFTLMYAISLFPVALLVTVTLRGAGNTQPHVKPQPQVKKDTKTETRKTK